MHGLIKLFPSVTSLCLLMGFAAAQADTVRSTVELTGIENIHLLGPQQLVVTQGDEELVAVIASRDDMDEVQAHIKGNTLVLGNERESFWPWMGDSSDRDVRFEVQVNRLKYLAHRGSGTILLGPVSSDGELELSVHGSGRVRAESLQADRLLLKVMGSATSEIDRVESAQLDLRVAGSANVDLGGVYARSTNADNGGSSKLSIKSQGSSRIRIAEGQFDSLYVSVHGSSDIDAGNLAVREAKVRIEGSGDVAVNARDALDVSINGSGDVLYRGQPANLRRSIRGSGDVRQRN